jgi:hypothetical protein
MNSEQKVEDTSREEVDALISTLHELQTQMGEQTTLPDSNNDSTRGVLSPTRPTADFTSNNLSQLETHHFLLSLLNSMWPRHCGRPTRCICNDMANRLCSLPILPLLWLGWIGLDLLQMGRMSDDLSPLISTLPLVTQDMELRL